jgi:hypothetical protein
VQYPATTATTRRKKPLTTAGKIACRRPELVLMLCVWHCYSPETFCQG